jgi:subfamily B ATP-binding cassette protein MsbA
VSEPCEANSAKRIDNLFLFKKLGVNAWLYLLAAVLMVTAAFFEGVSMALLIPLIKYFTTGDVAAAWSSPGLKQIKEFLPSLPYMNKPLITMLILLLSAVIAKNYFSYSGISLASRQARQVAKLLRLKILDRCLSQEKAFFDRWGQAFLQQVVFGFVSEIAKATTEFGRACQAGFMLVMYVVIMFFISPSLAIACLLFSPPMYFASAFILKKTRNAAREYTRTHIVLGNKIANALNCILLVKAYCNEKAEREWFDFASDRLMRLENNMDSKRWAIVPLNEIMASVAIAALLAGVSLFLTQGDPAKVSGYLVFFLMLKRSVAQFSATREFMGSLAQVKGHIQKVDQLFEKRPEEEVCSGTREFEGLKEGIRFEKLVFSYVEREDVLRGVSFEIKAGEKIAFVGATGSGKTTVANLLMRFYEVPEKTIFVDGVDIREYSIASIRHRVAMVSQAPSILNASFRLNLIYGLPRKVTESEIDEALKIAKLDKLVAMLGIDFEIGERGVKLSGGEKQRLSIARAILKKAEILILDEATSALDSETEKQVQEALEKVIREKTTVAIAHRLSTIKNVDRIIVLENGKISEQGTMQELLDLKGKFYQSWNTQQFF